MEFIPADASQSIEFDKILELLKRGCLSPLAAEHISELPYLDNSTAIQDQLMLVDEYRYLMVLSESLPIASYGEVRKQLDYLQTDGYVLEIEDIVEINHIIQIAKAIEQHFKKMEEEKAPRLKELFANLDFPAGIEKIIPRVVDDAGEIRANASVELSRIIRAIRSKEGQVLKEFNKILLQYKQKGLLSESEESYRNGRRVLSIPSEHKRQIKGIMHDESATGKTSYIEPESVVLINNDILELELEKRKEIYKILKELCLKLKGYTSYIHAYQAMLITLDVIQSKARLAVQIDGHRPKIVDQPCFKIIEGYHPLLKLKNKESAVTTVPFTLELKEQDRIFMISGPNAGGKSITLKAVGLLQLMVQFGCLVPVAADSEFGVFHTLCCDIGDQQSVEDDLSTYSGRLKNMKEFLERANSRSLVLIDEFGSGTDPKLGGAIAESILFTLHRKKIHAVITTHYSNLKVFAHKTKGIVNGAMHFDQEQLQPSYQLIVGKPGGSFAFEIAEKVGLPQRVLHFAKKNAGVSLKAMDSLISDLTKQQKKLADKEEELQKKEKVLDRLTSNYNTLQGELDIQRKKFKKVRKEFEVNGIARDKKQLEKLVKDLRESQNIEKAKEVLAEVKTKQKDVQQTVESLKEEIFEVTPDGEIPIVGDFVKTRNGSLYGQVVKIKKNKLIIETGNMQISVAMADCIKINRPIEKNSKKRINTYLKTETSAIESKIDIRGYRRAESLLLLEEFLDNALISNANMIKIIHGTGNGVLRRAVREKLREYKDIKSITSPPDEQGGEGVTLVNF